METLLASELANNVKVVVYASGTGFRVNVHHPDAYGSDIMVSPVLGRKLPWKTAEGALKAGLKYVNENYAHIIDPEGYWA